MDCIQAQGLISAALDREPLDAALLEQAKAHCRTCAQCGDFVRALTVIQRAPLPAPPADLPDRIMALVRAEAAAAEQASAAVTEQAAEAQALEAALDEVAPVPDDETDPTTLSALEAAALAAKARLAETSAGSRITLSAPKPTRAQAIAWIAGVAAVLVLVVVGGALGIMNSMNSRAAMDSQSAYNIAPAESASAPLETGQYGADAGAPDVGAAATSSPMQDTLAAKSATSTVLFVTYGGFVYRQAGSSKPSLVGLTQTGSLDMAFSAGAAPEMHDVYSAQGESDAIYIANGDKSYERFELVTRSYSGKTYVLNSSAIGTYGGWPTLPPGVPAPTSADGSPVFTKDGVDGLGVTVYRMPGANANAGIAIGPGTPTTDPVAGDPNWTWWTEKQ